MGCKLVMDAVTSEEGDRDGLACGWRRVLGDCDWRGGFAPRCADIEGGDGVKILE